MPHGDHFDIRITLPGGKRSKPVCMPPSMSYAMAKEKARVLTELAAREAVQAKAAAAPQPPPGSPAPAAVDTRRVLPPTSKLTATPKQAVEHLETFDEYLPRWLAERQARGLSSWDTDRGRLTKHVAPLLGPKPMVSITREHLEDVVEHLDDLVQAEKLAWLTAGHTWRTVKKMFSDACMAKKRKLRVRNDNPAAAIAGPERGVEKAKTYLYPSEFLTLADCALVPRDWRRLYAASIYLYARAGEVEALKLDAIEPERGNVHIHLGMDRQRKCEKSTKNKQSRRYSVEVEFLPLLRVMYNEAKDAGETALIRDMPSVDELSETLREHLKLAGVTRAELFTSDKTRKWITFHDLRATGITWMAVRGDEPLKIKYRAGHVSFSTTERYIREAEHVRDGFGEVFPPLPASLLGESKNVPAAEPVAPATAEPVSAVLQAGGSASIPTAATPSCAEQVPPPAEPSIFEVLPVSLLALFGPRVSSEVSSETIGPLAATTETSQDFNGLLAPPARVERTTFGLGNRRCHE